MNGSGMPTTGRMPLTMPTVFSRLLAGALSLGFFTYAFVNMGMVSDTPSVTIAVPP